MISSTRNMRPELAKATELLRSRDPRSVSEALRLLQNTVFNFSMKLCGHRKDAEDTNGVVHGQDVA